jgi:OPT family oligopeptide transporter
MAASDKPARAAGDGPLTGPDGRLRGTEGMGPEEIERYWYENVYQGDHVKQLTLRAVLFGMLLGGFMSLSNLYVGLKIGWSLGVSIVACVLAFSISKLLHMIGVFGTPLSILENNCMQSTASSAGYSTGGTIVSAISAYLIINGTHIGWGTLVLWVIFTSGLGVVLAIPMKRQMVNIEQLPFPTGLAAAETMRSLHAEGGGEASRNARTLGIAALIGALVAFVRDAKEWIPGTFGSGWIAAPFTAGKRSLAEFTLAFEGSAIMLAAGALMGIRAGWSIAAGAIVNYAVLAPWMYSLGDIQASGAMNAATGLAGLGFRDITKWSVWTGVSIMVTSSLLQFALEWRTVARAFSGITDIFSSKKRSAGEDPLERIEVPGSWFVIATLLLGTGCVIVGMVSFSIAWWMGIIAVLMSFVLCIVACRATGETDVTPQGAMGKITQLTYGVLAPSNMTTNLMTASITAGAAATSGDLLTELKSGYLLGANPRKQFIAQMLGVFAGTAVIVPVFYLLVPDAKVLGTSQWPAPAAQVWASVARLLANGVDSLPVTARWGMALGGLFGFAIPLCERLFPKTKKFLPSPAAFGLAFVVNGFNSISMFLGSVLGLAFLKLRPRLAEIYTIPVSSGLIAGESLMGVGIAIYTAVGMLMSK